MLDSIINWGLIKQPLNWVIIILMLIIAGMAVDILTGYHSKLTGKEV